MGEYDYWLPQRTERGFGDERQQTAPARRTKLRLFVRFALNTAVVLGTLGFLQVLVGTGKLSVALLMLPLALVAGLVTAALVLAVSNTDDPSFQEHAQHGSRLWNWRTFLILALVGGSGIVHAAGSPRYVYLPMLAAGIAMIVVDFRNRRAETGDR